MNKQISLKAALLISLMLPAPVIAQTSERRDGMRFVPDVLGQFRALTERADALGLDPRTSTGGESPDPSKCKHYQAITRADADDGTPYFLVTRSGNTPHPPGSLACNDSDDETGNGNLIVWRMDSRPKDGERMRSNRLQKGRHVDGTAPPPDDRVATFFTFVHGGLVPLDSNEPPPPRVYQHPGGMQLVGNVLAVALEEPRGLPPEYCEIVPDPVCAYDRAPDPTLIMFLDVGGDPGDVKFLSQFAPLHENGTPLTKAGVVAVTPLPALPGEAGRYLMAVTGGESETLFFYRSTPGALSDPALSWALVGTTRGPRIESGDEDPHQTLQFLREGNINGDLYLAGARGDANPFHDGENQHRLDLYKVDCGAPDCSAPVLTVEVHARRITPHPSTGGTRLAHLAAATGFHVTPSGELIFYATEHENDGPDETVKAGEWRHINMVREESPTLLPSATTDGPYEVDEGGSVALSGSTRPPITKAWIQLFHALDSGGGDFATFYAVVDYDDYELDDFDDFLALEIQLLGVGEFFTHKDKARSLRWFAPGGCTIRAIDHGGSTPNDLPETLTLRGDGKVHNEPDLTRVLNDDGTDAIDQEIDAVEFLADCNGYYTAPVDLWWDLDVNGSFETPGSPVSFDAGAFDGPSEVAVPAEARHSSGGPAGQATARVHVRNVAPQLTVFTVTDGAGNQVNAGGAFVLAGLPVTVAAGFTDPGLLDHQIATLAWGDGAVDSNPAFTAFDEAFADGTGSLSHMHAYLSAGSFPIALSVTDDDGGVDTESAVVRVVTPEQAVEEIIGLLDGVIAGTTNGDILMFLTHARRALAGSNDQSNNGALDKIRAGDDAAALAFLRQAISWLERAQADGADVATLVALLNQVATALSLG